MKTTAIIIIGRAIQVIISFLTIRVVTSSLSKESVGNYFIYISMMNYFGLAFMSPVGQYINRKLHGWEEIGVVLERLNMYFLYTLLVSLVAVPIVIMLNVKFGILAGLEPIQLATLLSVSIFFNTLITTIIPSLNMLNHRVAFVILTNSWLLLALALSIAAMKIFGNYVLPWFFGQLVAQCALVVISYVYMKKNIKRTKNEQGLNVITKENIKNIIKFCFPLLISTFLMWLATDSFRVVLEKTHGLEYVGVISVGFAVAQRISYAIESIVQQILYPNYYKEINTINEGKRYREWKKLVLITTPIYLISTILIILLAKILIKIFAGAEYEGEYIFVVYGGMFHFFRKLTAVLGMYAHNEMQTTLLVIPYFIGGVFSSVILYYSDAYWSNVPGVIVLGSFLMFTSMILSILFKRRRSNCV